MPVQSERKLIPLGSTLAVTIPVGWARYYGLKAKDRVTLIANGEIVIRRLEEKGENRTEEPNR